MTLLNRLPIIKGIMERRAFKKAKLDELYRIQLGEMANVHAGLKKLGKNEIIRMCLKMMTDLCKYEAKFGPVEKI